MSEQKQGKILIVDDNEDLLKAAKMHLKRHFAQVDIEKNPEAEITHLHLNDNTIMGFRLKNKKAFSVQYHPEASPGPHDSRYLFDQFVEMIKQDQSVIVNA